MKNHTWKIAVVLVAVGLAGGCKSARTKAFAARMQPPAGGGPQIMMVQPPENQVKEAGTLVQFHVGVAPPAGIVYQWRRDGVDIPGATNDSFTVAPVSMADVGTYSVRARRSTGTNEVSATAYLSVYTLWTTNSNGGTLSTPVGLFSSYSYTCGGTAFTRGYSPQSSTGPYFFYGPTATPQTGPFVNSSRSTRLILHTMDPRHEGRTTGIKLEKSFSEPPLLIDCQSTPIGTSGARLGPVTLQLGAVKKYRATIYYQPPEPSGGTISLYWTYY